MDIISTLVAHPQAPHAVQQRELLFDHPAITPQPLGRLDAAPRNARCDVAAAQAAPVGSGGIALVGVQLRRAAPGSAPAALHRRHGIHQREQLGYVGTIGRREADGERMADPIDQKVVLATCFGAVRRVGPRVRPPLLARMLEESAEARLQSIWPRVPSSSRKTRCSCCHTPAACQSRSRRQHVMPQTPKTSRGTASHWMPVFNTKMIPRKQARSSAGGRPPLGRGRWGGRSGCTRCHKASETSSRVMP